jgi:hypothetical protein
MSACLSVRPYVRMEQLESHWTDFLMKFDIWNFFENAKKFQILLKSNNNRYFT